MIYKKYIVFIMMILSLGCSSSNKITIKGTALEAKAGAVVVTNNEIVLYLDGVEPWKDYYTQYMNQKITVKGRLVTILDTFSNDKNNIATIRQSIKIKLLIKNPKIYNENLNKWKKIGK